MLRNDADPYLEARGQAIQRTAVVGALVNLLLSVVKIVVGWLAHSQALIADGVHSVSDLLSDALVWFAAHHAKQGPDDEHPYGHGRFETAATLALGALLGLVALGIVWDAAERLVHPDNLGPPGSIALYAAAFSILANEGLYWYTVIVARRIHSDLLRANAWHHRSDAASSVVVLFGVGGALMGWTYLDALAAIAVGLMVGKIGWDLGWEALQELVDRSLDEEIVQRVREVIMAVDGVRSVHMLRTRKSGHVASADVHVLVDPWLSVSEGHMISLTVEQRMKRDIREIEDVTVHVDPEDDETIPPNVHLPLRKQALQRLHAAWAEIPCFAQAERVLLHYLRGRIDVEVFLPRSCYQGDEQLQSMHQSMQERLDEDGDFGRVRLVFH